MRQPPVERMTKHLEILWRRRARCDQLKRPREALLGLLAALAHGSLRQLTTCFHVSRIVQQDQCLKRRVGLRAADLAKLTLRRIERVQRRWRRGALPERVQASAIQVLAMDLYIFGPRVVCSDDYVFP